MELYVELGFICGEWRIAKSKKLKSIALGYCAETLEVDDKNLHWYTDDLGDQRLLVRKSCLPEDVLVNDESLLKDLVTHFEGFMFGIGYA